MGLQWGDLFPDGKAKPHGNGRRIIKTYDYADASGNLLFQVVRFEPKSFAQRRPDGKGGWVWNRNGIEPTLYQLPKVPAAIASGGRIFIVEGEKDVATLEGAGLTATTNASGAGKWRAEYSKTLRGARVAVIPDNDGAGRKHGQEVAAALHGVAREIKIVELPGLPKKGDVSDWIANGGTREELERLVETVPLFTAEYKRRVLDEADACREPGEVGALLRREGLYSSHLSAWRRQREKALAAGLGPRKRGRRPAKDPQAERAERLERENARLRRQLDEAKAIIDIQKKVSQLLGIKLADVSEREKRLESEESDS